MIKMSKGVPYGLKIDDEGKESLVHVKEILPENRGDKCGLVCPHCREPLIANLPAKDPNYTPRLRHKTNQCDEALETALHMKAKEFILEAGELNFPELRVVHKGVSAFVIEQQRIVLTDIVLEQSINGIRPDIIGYFQEKPVYLEIKVTHGVDDEKKETIQQLNVACLEIDVSVLHDAWDEDGLRELVLHSVENKHWIHHPGVERVEKRLIEQALEVEHNKEQALKLKERHEEDRRAQAELAQQRKQEGIHQWLDKKRQLLAYCQVPEQLAHVKKQWADRAPTHQLYSYLFGQFLYPIEVFCDMNAMAIGCDYRIWQAYVFAYGLRSPIVTVQSLKTTIMDRFKLDLVDQLVFLQKDDRKEVGPVLDLTDTIYTYLMHLQLYGYVTFSNEPAQSVYLQKFELTDKMWTYLKSNGFIE